VVDNHLVERDFDARVAPRQFFGEQPMRRGRSTAQYTGLRHEERAGA
jgi:hypothetical protein